MNNYQSVRITYFADRHRLLIYVQIYMYI